MENIISVIRRNFVVQYFSDTRVYHAPFFIALLKEIEIQRFTPGEYTLALDARIASQALAQCREQLRQDWDGDLGY